MQQAYVNAFVHLDQFADRASFSTWLTRIATYEALARLRQRRRAKELGMYDTDDPLDAVASRDPDPERQALAGELRTALEQALDTLPPAYRAVFVMRDGEGMSTAEAAQCLEVSEEAVKTRLHRARTLLRDELWERAGIRAPEIFSFHAPRCDRVVAAVLARVTDPRVN
jgi:RNA polymerase sigma-70 factor (ECF subfamily)